MKKKYNIILPTNYEKFLAKYGYVNIRNTYIRFTYGNFSDDVGVVDILGNKDVGGFTFYNDNFKEELPENFYIIAASEEGKFVIDGDTEVIYFWDDFRIFDISCDKQNIYPITDNFNSFISLINNGLLNK
ncbi:SMI1/KNR4 family protein [Mollicutes bacterium LVI A0078]|nr:SMI1/KNR4 family protein [Mollicutes bacterium LVI A0075]WOO91878.1 SMI1/KNR4 family protein [Mollicutes bacterium LVI A0078]